MTITVPGSDNYGRTYLQAVNRILILIGETEIGTLISPSRRTTAAMTAVQEARDEVWYESLWPWRHGHLRINLVAGTMWYALPSDWCDMDTGLSKNADEQPLGFLNYRRFIEKYPNLRAFPPGETVTDLSTVGQLAAQVADSINYGEPECYTIEGGYIGVMPIPDATFVADEPSLYATYWRAAPPLASDQDDLGVPPEILGTIHKLALGYLKVAAEYDDGYADQSKGLRDLRRKKAQGTKSGADFDLYYRPDINYNE